jgi:hypothetical protein
VTRIPQLEQELVAAAARRRSPRRLVRPAVRAVLAAGAAAVAVALGVVVAADDDAERRPQPAPGVQSPPATNDDSSLYPSLSSRQQVARIANRWAPLFAAAPNPDACAGYDPLHPSREVAAKYMAQPPCEQAVCKRVPDETIENCTPLSPEFQRSFENATVEDVAERGNRAAARFSNGATVVLQKVKQSGLEPRPPPWLITKIGGDAYRRFFGPDS